MIARTQCPDRSRIFVSVSACLFAFAVGSLPAPVHAAVRNAEDLLIVDCLLPGQIRKLGRQATYLSARRPVRTTQPTSSSPGETNLLRSSYTTVPPSRRSNVSRWEPRWLRPKPMLPAYE